jgi:hypothetical protein
MTDYESACLSVVEAIRDNLPIDDEELCCLLREQPDHTARKALLMGLWGCGVAREEQVTKVFQYNPEMKEA